MTDPDQIARELLPCRWKHDRPNWETGEIVHSEMCPAHYRPQVAAALTAERDSARDAIDKMQDQYLREGGLLEQARNAALGEAANHVLYWWPERGEQCALEIRSLKTPERAAVGETAPRNMTAVESKAADAAFQRGMTNIVDLPNPTLDELRERVVEAQVTCAEAVQKWRANRDNRSRPLNVEECALWNSGLILDDRLATFQAAHAKEGG